MLVQPKVDVLMDQSPDNFDSTVIPMPPEARTAHLPTTRSARREADRGEALVVGEESSKHFDWKDLRLFPVNIYAGEPVWREMYVARRTDNVVVFWQQVAGSVRMTCKSLQVEVGPSGFMVCLPGARFQELSEDAWIRAVYFAFETPHGGAVWRGPHLVGLLANAELDRRLARVFDHAKAIGLCDERWHRHQRIEAVLPSWLDLQLRLYSLVVELLPLLKERGAVFEPEKKRESRVEEGIRWMRRRPIDHDFDRGEFARASHLSPSQVDRLWRREMEQTPRQYWEERRLGWACRQLASEGVSIKETAFEMGFASLSRFSTWFKRHTNQCPREYRESLL